MKEAFKFSLFFIVVCIGIFTFVSAQNLPGNSDAASRFPYKINFTPAELKLLNSLDEATLTKLILIAQNLVKKNTGSATVSTTTPALTTTPTPTAQTPFYNPQTGRYQNTPTPNSPFVGGQNESMDQNGYTRADYAAAASAANEYQSQIGPAIDPRQVDFSKLPPDANGTCSEFGVVGNIGNVSAKLKFDMACICRAFGGKNIAHEGTTRNGTCRSGDQHSCGKAIDIKTNQYGDKAKNAMLVTVLIALGYNIGSYQAGFTSFHADHQSDDPKWKTWSGVAHTNYAGANQRPYIQEVRDALVMIGKLVNSSAEFRLKYGSYNRNLMRQDAARVVEEKGSDAMKQCIKNTMSN